MYLDADGNVIKNASLRGHLAVGVPGTVAGMLVAHEKFGSMVWADLLAPAIKLARDGFVLSPRGAHVQPLSERFFRTQHTYAMC